MKTIKKMSVEEIICEFEKSEICVKVKKLEFAMWVFLLDICLIAVALFALVITK